MKFELCSRKITEVCRDQKFCCKAFECTIISRTFDVSNYNAKVTVRNENRYIFLPHEEKEYQWDQFQLNYCPFCGEKIE